MLFEGPPPWSLGRDAYGNVTTMQTTDVWDPAFQLICEQGLFQQYLEGNGIDFMPVHDLLQNMFRSDPQQRWSTDQILDHPWLSEI